ncbi:TadE/TadG family type IV pilus assembly protein [Sphingomonas sp. VNH70]|uniref:TadE/TadG family type IV pilus assembly protein n=1 Tax=Sphingomonas silueang TaxID=3156617 RepID=UPI0032B38265
MRRLVRDRRGATLVEFALVSPVLFLLLIGLFDLGFQAYARNLLSGAVQAAARKATLEGNSSETTTAALDAAIVEQMRLLGHDLRWNSTRKSYRKFGDIRAEPFDDANRNGVRDNGECYSDVNDNRRWDGDPGATGQGGANDITVYTITITYPRPFPLAGMIGIPADQSVTASTMLKNQPYGAQGGGTPVQRCG